MELIRARLWLAALRKPPEAQRRLWRRMPATLAPDAQDSTAKPKRAISFWSMPSLMMAIASAESSLRQRSFR